MTDRRTTTTDRRTLLVGAVALLGGCSVLRDSPGAVSADGSTAIESGVADRVFLEPEASALPTPEVPPALGVTNAGLYQFTESTGGWVPFRWASVLDVDDGGVRLGTESDPLRSVTAETIDAVPQARARIEGGRGTKDDPFNLPAAFLEDADGTVAFGPGWYEADGLATAADTGFEESSVYLEGEGVRTTTLLHAAEAPSSPTVHFRGAGGNFGGIRDMTVYGAGEGEAGSGSAHIVQSDGEVIDHQFENVIVRWGGGDVLHLEHSASGTRVQNAWLENSPGWALYLGGGSRQKVDSVHTAGTEGGIRTEGTGGNFSNLTLTSLRGHSGVEATSSGNNFSNVIVRLQVDRGFEVRGADTTIGNVLVEESNREALFLAGTSAVSNVVAKDCGADGTSVIRILGDDTTVSNVRATRTDPAYSTDLLSLETDHCRIDGLWGDPADEWALRIRPGATENVLDGVRGVPHDRVSDDGTRTLINGWGTNDGDPDATGEWHGHADYAGRMGATIWDTSGREWTPYVASPAGDWIAVGG